MDEGQNAITDLNPVNTPLENLFLVFILSYALFIPLKQINPHKKSKTKQKIQAKKSPKQWKPTNQQKKNPQDPKTKQKSTPKPKQNCRDNFCPLSLSHFRLSSITPCMTRLCLQGFTSFNCRQSFTLPYTPALISLIIDIKTKNRVQIYCLHSHHCKRANPNFQSWQLKNVELEISATGIH